MITETGLTIKRYEEIVAELETELRGYFGNDVDLSDDSLFGIINKIYANAQAEQWEMANAVYNAFNIDVATGKQLDDLVALVGLTRLPESKTTGTLSFIGDNNTIIPAGSEFRTSTTNISTFLDTSVTIDLSNCYTAGFSTPSVSDADIFTLNINGTNYSYTATAGDTQDVVLTALRDSINFDISASWIANFEVGDPSLEVVSGNITFPLAIVFSATLNNDFVGSNGQATVADFGEIEILQETVTVIPTPIAGLTSVNNPDNFSTGRLQETDDELRLRQSVSTSIIGSSSRNAIESKIKQLDGVNYAQVFENTTLAIDARGLPPKSFEAVVDGGVDSLIASTIYTEKPAGIQTHGNTVGVVTGTDGNTYAIKFTRPNDINIYFDVKYSLYDEEAFPANGEQLIKDAIVLYGNTLLLGEDVIAQRFLGTIYQNVEGLQNLKILIGYTSGTRTELVLPVDADERARIIDANINVGLDT